MQESVRVDWALCYFRDMMAMTMELSATGREELRRQIARDAILRHSRACELARCTTMMHRAMGEVLDDYSAREDINQLAELADAYGHVGSLPK